MQIEVFVCNKRYFNEMNKISADFLTKYSVRDRMKEIESFNANNRWKKKGLAVTPMKYKYNTTKLPLFFSI